MAVVCRLIWWHKSKQLFFIPILLLFILNSQCLGIKKPSSLALFSFSSLADLNKENMRVVRVVRMAVNLEKAWWPHMYLKRWKKEEKWNIFPEQWAFSSHLYFLQGSYQGSPRQTWGNHSLSKLFSSWQDSLAQYQMTSADVQVNLYPQGTWTS